MTAKIIPFNTLERRHIPPQALEVIHGVSRIMISGAENEPPTPRRMIALEEEGALKVFSEYENNNQKPELRMKYFFSDNASKVRVECSHTNLSRDITVFASLSSREVDGFDIEEAAELLMHGLFGPEDDEEFDDDLFHTDDEDF